MGRRGRSAFGTEGHTYFITTTAVEFVDIFSCGTQYYDILVHSLNHELKEHRALLRAYVFMPSHIHFVVSMPTGQNISDLMRDFKKYTSTRVRQLLQKDGQKGILQVLMRNAHDKKGQIFKLWTDRFDDVVIRDLEMLTVKINYIHNNPVKARLVSAPEDWKYSSARDYLGLGDGPLSVATGWFAEGEGLDLQVFTK